MLAIFVPENRGRDVTTEGGDFEVVLVTLIVSTAYIVFFLNFRIKMVNPGFISSYMCQKMSLSLCDIHQEVID